MVCRTREECGSLAAQRKPGGTTWYGCDRATSAGGRTGFVKINYLTWVIFWVGMLGGC